mgnify:CR=1 FL=1
MVITDVRVPRRDGLSVAMVIRHEAPTVPITIVTGHGNEEMAITALRAGVTDFIKKPVRLEDLTAALDRMDAAVRAARQEIVDLPAAVTMVESSSTYLLDNDRDAIPVFVEVALKRCSAGVDRPMVMELRLS